LPPVVLNFPEFGLTLFLQMLVVGLPIGGFQVLLVTHPRFSFFIDQALDLFFAVIEPVLMFLNI